MSILPALNKGIDGRCVWGFDGGLQEYGKDTGLTLHAFTRSFIHYEMLACLMYTYLSEHGGYRKGTGGS